MLTRLLFAASALLAATAPAPATAQAFPNHPIKLIIPVPPGGTGDLIGRLISSNAGELGQPIIIDNRAGAAGNVGTAAAARAAADGYTIVQCSIGTCAINPSLYKNTGYDLFKDFVPVILLGSSINVLTVGNETGITSLNGLIEQAKTKHLAFGSSGVGASNQLAGELLKRAAKIDMLHVPYKGSGPAITDLLGGQIQVFFDNEPSILPFVKSGKVRALAVTGRTRSANLPDVPTMAELGYPDFIIEPWYAIAAPAGTPPAVVAKLNQGLEAALKQPEVRQAMLKLGITPRGGAPEVLGQLMHSEYERWGALIRAQHISGD